MMYWCRRRRLLSLMAACASIYFLFIIYTSLTSGFSSNHGSSSHDNVKAGQTMDTHLSKDAVFWQQERIYPNFSYHYDMNDENSMLRDNDIYNSDLGAGKYEHTNTLGNYVEHSEKHREAEDSFLDGKMRHLSETVIKTNSAIEIVSKKIHYIRDFVKEHTDIFTSEGEESDYLFPPCQDKSAVEDDSLYGFVGPFRYLANYKNPCWMEPADEDAPVVYCVPYFYLAGAPKAGSTDVYKRICMHPDVVKPASKETRWFDRARFLDKPHFSSFLRNFYNASGVISRSLDKGSNYHSRIVGDGSPSYFFDNRQWPLMPGNEQCTEPRVTVASYIHHLYPKARIIFILRNPVDRLYSSYLYNHAKYEAVSSSTFDQYAREAVKLYSDCFVRYSVRQCANNATIFQQAKVMLVVSLYRVFIQDWLELFPREQLLIISTEKYNQNMVHHLRKIFTFLGLRTLNSTELQAITQPEVHNRGQHYSRTGPMWKETRILLEDFYRPYNQQLANLLNNPDFLWRE